MERRVLQKVLEGDLGMSSSGGCSRFGVYFLECISFLTPTYLMSHTPAGFNNI